MQANQYYSKSNRAKRIAKIVGNILFYTVVLIVIAMGVVSVVGRAQGKKDGGFGIFGYNAYVVQTGSMRKINDAHTRHDDVAALGNTQFDKGDLVIVRNLRPDEEVHDLDAVTFRMDGVIVIHRVVRIETDSDGTVFYVTQGDANPNADGGRTRDEIMGVYVTNWGAKAGTFVSFLQSAWGIAGIAIAIGVCITASLVYDAIKGKEKAREPDDLPEEAVDIPTENPSL